MPNYKQLLDIANATLVAMGDAMMNMGLNIPLVWNELARSFQNKSKALLHDAGIVIDGSDVKSITESFTSKMLEIGFTQRVVPIEVSDDKIVIDIGECIFGAATQCFRGNDLNFIPPCPMLAILYAAIEEKTGKIAHVETCLWKPNENTSVFTLKLEG